MAATTVVVIVALVAVVVAFVARCLVCFLAVYWNACALPCVRVSGRLLERSHCNRWRCVCMHAFHAALAAGGHPSRPCHNGLLLQPGLEEAALSRHRGGHKDACCIR